MKSNHVKKCLGFFLSSSKTSTLNLLGAGSDLYSRSVKSTDLKAQLNNGTPHPPKAEAVKVRCCRKAWQF